MHSKTLLFAALSFSFLLCACTARVGEDPEYVIGNMVDSMSSLNPSGVRAASQMVIYDKTVKRIHQFDVDQMTYGQSFAVEDAEQEHYVLADAEGRYIIDLTKKGFAIIRTETGKATRNPIKLQGNPRSAAFRPDKGLLVVYDDISSVGILKLSSDGYIQNTAVLGSELVDGASISAGDIVESGHLVVGLSDSSMAVVDLEQTLALHKWVFTRFTTTLEQISWVAPVLGQPSQVLAKSLGQVSVIDVGSQGIVSQRSGNEAVLKFSKSVDAHLILKDAAANILVYVNQGQIKTKTLYRQEGSVLASYLNLAEDGWAVIEAKLKTIYIYNDPNESSETRNYKKYRLSDMLALETKELPAKAKLQMANNFIFALFPSELGYAVRYDTDGNNKSELKYFNVKHIK